MVEASSTIFHCPACGGPTGAPRATVCEFCEGPLLPMGTPDPRHAVRCSSCTALVSAGASYCPRCGDPLAQAPSMPADHACPACPGGTMESFALLPTPRHPSGWAVHGCRGCGGVWVDRATLEAMLDSAVRHNVGDGRASNVKRRQLSMQGGVVYRSCSVCGNPMNRRNFARISGVVVDECRDHGSFFDAGELEDVLAFVRSGGMLLASHRRNEELGRERRAAEAAAVSSHRSGLMTEVEPMTGLAITDMADGADLGFAFMRWAARWVRNMFR